MSKSELISNEYKRLKNLFLNCEESKQVLIDELIRKAAFLKVELDDLEDDVHKGGVVQVSSKGNVRVNFAYKAYLQALSLYSSIIKNLNAILGDNSNVLDDEFDEFIKKVEEK